MQIDQVLHVQTPHAWKGDIQLQTQAVSQSLIRTSEYYTVHTDDRYSYCQEIFKQSEKGSNEEEFRRDECVSVSVLCASVKRRKAGKREREKTLLTWHYKNTPGEPANNLIDTPRGKKECENIRKEI